MKKINLLIKLLAAIIILILPVTTIPGQQKSKKENPVKAEIYKAKTDALEYLQDSGIIRKFGVISDSIWNFAELGMQEFKSSAILIKALSAEGFAIEKNVSGMPTCFIAKWGAGKPVIGILGEYDALPMLSQKALTAVQNPIVPGAPGHGCGHNMMGTAGIAAAIAVKRSMEQNHIGGTIKFFGSPAEETLISRPYMVRDGVFSDVDAVIDNHASSSLETGYGVSGNAVMSVLFTFKGRTAHAASAPWSGISALDAVELMNVATNFLREHLFYTFRMHYVITEGGEAPNIVPDKATVWYYLRNTDEKFEELYKRVLDCAKGAALASGATLDTVRIISACHQKHSNKGVAEAIQRNIELIGMPQWTEAENMFAKSLQKEMKAKEDGYPIKFNILHEPPAIQLGGGSTDVGDVSLIVPTATLNFPGIVPGVIGHHWSTTTSGYGSAAWKGLNTGARIIAATTLDLLTKPKMLQAIRSEFETYSKEHPFRSFLPEGARPPLDLNKELMQKYRNALMEEGEER